MQNCHFWQIRWCLFWCLERAKRMKFFRQILTQTCFKLSIIMDYRMDYRGWDQLFWNPRSISVLEVPSDQWGSGWFDQEIKSKKKKDKIEPSLLVNKPKQKVTDNEITWKFLRNFIDALLKRWQYRKNRFRHPKVGQDTPPQKTPKCQRCLTNSKLPRQKTSKNFSVKLMWKYHEQLQLHFTALWAWLI